MAWVRVCNAAAKADEEDRAEGVPQALRRGSVGEGSAPGADSALVSALSKASGAVLVARWEAEDPLLCMAALSLLHRADKCAVLVILACVTTDALILREQEVDDLPLLRGAGSSSGRALGTLSSAALPKDLLRAPGPGRYQA